MKDEKNNFTNIEQRVQKFFQKQAESLKAGKDLWSKLEPRLDANTTNTGPNKTKGKFWQWLAGPRLIAFSSSLAVVVILVVAGSLWITNTNAANSRAAAQSDKAGIVWGFNGGGSPVSTATYPPQIIPETTMVATTTTMPSATVLGTVGSTSNGTVYSTSGVPDTTGKQVIS